MSPLSFSAYVKACPMASLLVASLHFPSTKLRKHGNRRLSAGSCAPCLTNALWMTNPSGLRKFGLGQAASWDSHLYSCESHRTRYLLPGSSEIAAWSKGNRIAITLLSELCAVVSIFASGAPILQPIEASGTEQVRKRV